jgi:hypothetical protein
LLPQQRWLSFASYAQWGLGVGTQQCRGKYSYFRWARRSRLICAVEASQPLPHFIRAGTWVKFEPSPGDGDWPSSFDPSAAEFACGFQGFYLFHLGARAKRVSAAATSPTMRPAPRAFIIT